MFTTLSWTRDDESRGKHTGTFGEVHVWRRIKNGSKEMAVIKIPTVPQHIEKLKKERDKMLQVGHKNIVCCLSPAIFGDDFNLEKQYKNGILWKDVLVMEYCDSGNLRRVFNQNKYGVRLSELLNICSDLGSALQYLHEVHHIIHRDIKPENVFLTKTADKARPVLYKIGDLGEVTEVMKSDGMTHVCTLQTHGTFAYMAPEQLLFDPYDGTMKMGESTDLWGFGTIVSEAAFGIRPFYHDQGHHIHMDIDSYCSSIMEKSDDTIHIYKDGQLRDPAFLPVHRSEIPHNDTLPHFIIHKIYKILCSALVSNRKERGNYSNGSYGIYDLLNQLTSCKICQVFHCGHIKMQEIDLNKGIDFTENYDNSNGLIVSQNLEVNPKQFYPGFYLYLTEFIDSSVCMPKIPHVLELYFSEPFPSYQKGVERSLNGFLVKLRVILDDVLKGVKILVQFLNKTKVNFEEKYFIQFRTLVELSESKLYQSFLASCTETISVVSIITNLENLQYDVQCHIEYTNFWLETFRGLSSKTEWTDVYLLVDNFKEKYSDLIIKFAKCSGNAFLFNKALIYLENEIKSSTLELNKLILERPSSNDKKEKQDVQLLLDENVKLFDQLKFELGENYDL